MDTLWDFLIELEGSLVLQNALHRRALQWATPSAFDHVTPKDLDLHSEVSNVSSLHTVTMRTSLHCTP